MHAILDWLVSEGRVPGCALNNKVELCESKTTLGIDEPLSALLKVGSM